MKTLLSLLFVIILSDLSIAQPIIEWQKSFGGTSGDLAYSTQQTSDGGYIVVGQSTSTDGDVTGNHGDVDYWVVKLTTTGIIDWQKSLGGTSEDLVTTIQQTSDGGYIVAGSSNSNDGDVTDNHGDFDCWVVKLTSTGIITWQKSLGTAGKDMAKSIQQTSDGGYIVAGSQGGTLMNMNDYWVVKLTNTGAITWERSLGGTAADDATSIKQTSDGGYIVAGYSNSNDEDVTGNHGTFDFWIVKLTSSGTIAWQKCLGGTSTDLAKSIQQTTDGGYIVAGYSYSADGDVTDNHGDRDYWVVKLTSTGVIEWQKSLGGSGLDYAQSIQQTIDGGYIVAGHSNSNDGDVTGSQGGNDMWIVKLTIAGTIAWEKSLGGTSADGGYSIQQTSDDGFIVAGYSYSTDGDVTDNLGGADYWVVKLSPETGIEENSLSNLSIYPNPTSGKITISLEDVKQGLNATLTNILGEVILTQQFGSTDIINIDIDAPTGIYFLHLEGENGEDKTIKIIKK